MQQYEKQQLELELEEILQENNNLHNIIKETKNENIELVEKVNVYSNYKSERD